jgi:hypothetical protein
MTPSLRRELALLALVSTAPLALGVAMHLDHTVASPTVIEVEVATAVPTPIAIVTTTPPVVPPAVDEVPAPAPTQAFAYGETFAFVTDGPEGALVVLDTAPGDWGIGATTLTSEEYGETFVRRDVNLDAISPRLRNRIGEGYDLFAGPDHVCTAAIGEPFLMWDVSSADDPDDFANDGEVPMSLEAWVVESGRELLVAPLDRTGCGDATWARLANLPDPRVFTRIDRPAPEATRLSRRTFLRSPAMKESRREYTEFFEDWPAQEREPVEPFWKQLTSTAWSDADGKMRLVTHDLHGDSYGGCGGLSPQFGATLVSDGGATVDHVLAGDGRAVETILDIDGDGTPELLVRPRDWESFGLLTVGDDGLHSLAEMDAQPFFGCPC